MDTLGGIKPELIIDPSYGEAFGPQGWLHSFTMNNPTGIPKDEQLRALAGGLVEVYKLIEPYTGAPVSTDFRKFVTVTKPELIEYLRQHPGMLERHQI